MSIQARRKQREEENMDRKAEKAQQHRWVGWVSVFGWNLLGKLSAKKMWLKYGFFPKEGGGGTVGQYTVDSNQTGRLGPTQNLFLKIHK